MPLKAFMRVMAVVNPMLRPFGFVVWFIADVDEFGQRPVRVVGVRIGRLPRLSRGG